MEDVKTDSVVFLLDSRVRDLALNARLKNRTEPSSSYICLVAAADTKTCNSGSKS